MFASLVKLLGELVEVCAFLLGGATWGVIAVVDMELGLVNLEVDRHNVGASCCSCPSLWREGFANI